MIKSRFFIHGKKGEEESLITNTLAGLLFLAFVIAAAWLVIWMLTNGAIFWGDYESHALARLINNAQPGDKIILDVSKFTQIAQKNGVKSMSEVFNFDNEKKEICLKLSKGKKSCYNYFKNYNIVGQKLNLGVYGQNLNLLSFTIEAPKKNVQEVTP